MNIGPYKLDNRLIAAPMAGVTDRPFRQLTRRFGAAMAVSEMVSSQASLRNSTKSRRRSEHTGETHPISVQIAGSDPVAMAEAARYNMERGAQIIDINMGCPAKKVCQVMAGSALLQDESLVARILDAVVKAVPIPVTLKIRTGSSPAQRNAITIARIAEASGIQALAVHGRTRACMFNGSAEYETIARVKNAVGIPVIANGDITSPEQAQDVLAQTGADAVMIGRASLGRPWIFREIVHYLDTGTHAPAADVDEIRGTLVAHLQELHSFYGELAGVRIARKHIAWYTSALKGAERFRAQVNAAENMHAQLSAVNAYFDGLSELGSTLSYAEARAA
jgi:tRNA-dihydrouridine synthase B